MGNAARSLRLTATSVMFIALLAAHDNLTTTVHSAGRPTSLFVDADSDETMVTVEVTNGDDLQKTLDNYAGTDCCVRLKGPSTLTCSVRDHRIGEERSVHALLVPDNVRLDLNGSTLRLDLRSNSYGIRLASHSAILNGTIRIVASEGKGSQGIWHSGISVGAAYGDGGTPEKPGRFSVVSHWAIENITIDQPFAASAIQLMSEACHGTIRNVRILDSDKALLGIGLDWGAVGPITTEDKEIPRMRRLWEQGKIYSTHPHDVIIENVQIGKLLRNVDANDAGVRLSACHRITIRNLAVDTAASAIAIFGGDFGYEFAPKEYRDLAHFGHIVEGVRITNALRFGLVLNGLADNIWRSSVKYGYQVVRDPTHPGLDKITIKNVNLQGSNQPHSQGIYAVSLTAATLEDVTINSFAIGVHVEDWVRGMTFRNSHITGNHTNIVVEGATEPATNVIFEPSK